MLVNQYNEINISHETSVFDDKYWSIFISDYKRKQEEDIFPVFDDGCLLQFYFYERSVNVHLD